VLALDRLEKALACPDALGTRLRHAVSDLQLAATGNAAATAIIASLSTCITWVEHDGESFQEAVQAHMDALRWTISIGGGADSSAALRVMIGALRAMVRSLSLRDGNGPNLWPDCAFGARDHGGEAGPLTQGRVGVGEAVKHIGTRAGMSRRRAIPARPFHSAASAGPFLAFYARSPGAGCRIRQLSLPFCLANKHKKRRGERAPNSAFQGAMKGMEQWLSQP